MSHDIFICYSARDKTVANAVCAVMEAEGVRCWIAPRDILPGADSGESIIDAINEAREGMNSAGQQEATMRMAYQRAAVTRTRAGYQTFLSQYGSSSYAADIRQRMAACHTETRNTSSTQNSQVEKDGSGQASNPTAACSEARTDAIDRISEVCTQTQARLGPVQVLNQNVQNAPSNGAGQAVGSLLGEALFGSAGRNVSVPTQYQCTVSGGGACEKQINGAQSVDVCP